MTFLLSTAALALGLVTVLLRFASNRDRPGPADRLADLALLAAAACVLAGVALPEAWSSVLAQAPPMNAPAQPMDARVPSHLALVVAALASLPAAIRRREGGVRWLAALMPGVLIAAAVAGTLTFIGLREAFALGIAAVGALAGGVALTGFFTNLGSPGSTRWRALLVFAGSALAVAATLALYGLRSDARSLKQDESFDASGFDVAYRGLADSTRNPVTLSVELQQGMKVREYRPSLSVADSTVSAHPVGEWFAGPVLAALAWREENAGAHASRWLGKGDSLAVRDAMLTFRGFRLVQGEPIRFFADLDVRRAGTLTRVSPGLAATSAGSTPFAAEIPGLGPVAVVKMDADGGRVALMMAGLEPEPGTSVATLRLQGRPGLEAAWGALVLSLIAFLLAAFAKEPAQRSSI